jgi:hypothetical protein
MVHSLDCDQSRLVGFGTLSTRLRASIAGPDQYGDNILTAVTAVIV